MSKHAKKYPYPYGSGLCPVCAEVIALRADMKTLRAHGKRNAPCPGKVRPVPLPCEELK